MSSLDKRNGSNGGNGGVNNITAVISLFGMYQIVTLHTLNLYSFSSYAFTKLWNKKKEKRKEEGISSSGPGRTCWVTGKGCPLRGAVVRHDGVGRGKK